VKILFVHNRYLQSSGGEDVVVDAEAKLLISKGHTVEIAFFDNAHIGNSTLAKIKAGANSIYSKKSKDRLKKTIADFGPDIVHVHNVYFEASPAVFDAAYECKVPVVFTSHNYRLLCVNAMLLRNGRVCEDCTNLYFPWKGVIRKCYHDSVVDSALVGLITTAHKAKGTWSKKIDRIITPSAFMRQKLLQGALSLNPDKVAVKHNFIEDPGTGPSTNRQNAYVFIGRLSEEKGLDFLLKSFSRMPDKYIQIAGDGPDREKLFKEYGHLPNVSFIGRQSKEQVFQLLKTCRAMLFSSIIYEGMPLTIIEAFATGTPVIASNLGAMQEMIIPGQNGLLFEKDNFESLNNVLNIFEQTLSTGDLSLYGGARKNYLENYHPDTCYQKVLSIYETVIDQYPASS
jgi:glycosyltransferase involved in cell wall biosynthesis